MADAPLVLVFIGLRALFVGHNSGCDDDADGESLRPYTGLDHLSAGSRQNGMRLLQE